MNLFKIFLLSRSKGPATAPFPGVPELDFPDLASGVFWSSRGWLRERVISSEIFLNFGELEMSSSRWEVLPLVGVSSYLGGGAGGGVFLNLRLRGGGSYAPRSGTSRGRPSASLFEG